MTWNQWIAIGVEVVVMVAVIVVTIRFAGREEP